MSTRCQVRVTQSGLGWDESVTLYHHSDGYPSWMVPLIQKSYDAYGGGWEAGRAGKVAAMLIGSDVEGYEPEAGHELHGDIAFYYVLDVRNKSMGTLAEKPEWHLAVYTVPIDCKSVDGMTEIAAGLVHTLDGEVIEKATA